MPPNKEARGAAPAGRGTRPRKGAKTEVDQGSGVSSPPGSSPAHYGERATRFLGELGELAEADWWTIAQRFLERQKSLATTVRAADHILADISSGKIKPFGRTLAKWRVMVRAANAAMFAATTHLPKTKLVSGEEVAFQESAYLALYHAVSALKVFAELDHTREGREVVLELLSPFEGLVPSVLA